jgi:2-methylfumaryl-CoA isomerase
MVAGLGLADPVAAIEAETGADFAADEGARYRHRDRLFPLVEAAIAARPLAEVARLLDANAVTWGGYQRLSRALADPRLVAGNPVFATIAHPSGHAYPTPGAPATLPALDRAPPLPAPRLGADTDEVLAALLGLPDHEIARLHDAGLVAGPARD